MYYFAYGCLYLLSLLPFRVLFWLSDAVFFILYYIVGYRKAVVMDNLATAFPEKTLAERKRIAKKFYRNFTDNWIEALKLLSISSEAISRRITTDFRDLQAVYDSGRNCQVLMGHLFNWEWGNASVPLRVPFTPLVAYSPLSSKITDRLFKKLRSRFGSIMLPYNDMRRAMMPYRHSQHLLGLVADQNPSNPLKSYWLPFLNRPTAFLQGPEKGARAGNIPVVFLSFVKTRRGYYHHETKLLHDNPAQTSAGELTRMYVRELEAHIRQYPELYLWSHKRWKHEWKEPYLKLWVGELPEAGGLAQGKI